MAGMRFLNPILKIMLCLTGMAVIGYFLYPSISEGNFWDGLTIGRGLVFFGFTYLFVQSLRELIDRPRS
jgi:hypothetical protein